MTLFLELVAVVGLHAPERVLRRGRVRARDGAPDADPRARSSRATAAPAPCSRSPPTSRVHRRDAVRGHPHLARHRCPWRAVLSDYPRPGLVRSRGRPRLHPHHVPARGDRRAGAQGARTRLSGSDGARRLGAGPRVLRRRRAFAWILQRSTSVALSFSACGRPAGDRGTFGGRAEDPRPRPSDAGEIERASGRCSTRSSTSRTRRSTGDGAPAAGRRDLGRAAARGGLAALLESPFTRYPVYRDRSTRSRRPPRSRPLLGAPRPRDRERRDRGVPPSRRTSSRRPRISARS